MRVYIGTTSGKDLKESSKYLVVRLSRSLYKLKERTSFGCDYVAEINTLGDILDISSICDAPIILRKWKNGEKKVPCIIICDKSITY